MWSWLLLTGCFPHSNPCDPLSESYPDACLSLSDDTAGESAGTDSEGEGGGGGGDDGGDPDSGDLLEVTGTRREDSFAVPDSSPHALAWSQGALWAGGWSEYSLYQLNAAGGVTTQWTLESGFKVLDLAADGEGGFWALDSAGDLWVISGSGSAESTDVSGGVGVAYDGQYVCVLVGSRLEHYEPSSWVNQYQSDWKGTQGPIAYSDGRFITARVEGSGDYEVTLELLDASSYSQNDVVDEIAVDMDASSISGISVDSGDLYLMGDGYGDDADLVVRYTLE
jgi:hypothetical protein